MTSLIKQASSAEITQTLKDRDWWREFGASLGWNLFGWTYRQTALFYDENGGTVELTAAHVRLLEKVKSDAAQLESKP